MRSELDDGEAYWALEVGRAAKRGESSFLMICSMAARRHKSPQRRPIYGPRASGFDLWAEDPCCAARISRSAASVHLSDQRTPRSSLRPTLGRQPSETTTPPRTPPPHPSASPPPGGRTALRRRRRLRSAPAAARSRRCAVLGKKVTLPSLPPSDWTRLTPRGPLLLAECRLMRSELWL